MLRGHHDECHTLQHRQHVDHADRRRFAVRLRLWRKQQTKPKISDTNCHVMSSCHHVMIFQSFAQSLICLALEQTLKGSSTLSAIVSVAGACRVFCKEKLLTNVLNLKHLLRHVAACCGISDRFLGVKQLHCSALGDRYLMAGARSNIGLKSGRYAFEAGHFRPSVASIACAFVFLVFARNVLHMRISSCVSVSIL